jgi:hypothetical protein
MADCNNHQHNQSKFFFLHLLLQFSSFLFFSSIKSICCRFNHQSCHGSRLSTKQTSLGWRRSSSSKLGSAPDSHRPHKTGPSSLPSQIVQFLQLRAGASGLCLFCVRTQFGDSAEESTNSSTSSMKVGNSGNNGFDLDKGNILKPTFDILMEKGRKAFEAYHTNIEELFLSQCEVT